MVKSAVHDAWFCVWRLSLLFFALKNRMILSMTFAFVAFVLAERSQVGLHYWGRTAQPAASHGTYHNMMRIFVHTCAPQHHKENGMLISCLHAYEQLYARMAMHMFSVFGASIFKGMSQSRINILKKMYTYTHTCTWKLAKRPYIHTNIHTYTQFHARRFSTARFDPETNLPMTGLRGMCPTFGAEKCMTTLSSTCVVKISTKRRRSNWTSKIARLWVWRQKRWIAVIAWYG